MEIGKGYYSIYERTNILLSWKCLILMLQNFNHIPSLPFLSISLLPSVTTIMKKGLSKFCYLLNARYCLSFSPFFFFYFCTTYNNGACSSPIQFFFFFLLITWLTPGIFHIAKVPSVTWFSSEESDVWVLDFVVTRENP